MRFRGLLSGVGAARLRAVETLKLNVVCDGNRLKGGVVVPDDPRGLVLLLHGVPSIQPPEPGDTGYPGLAETFAEDGWAAAWVDLRAVRSSRGFFSIEGWVRDVRASLDAARAVEGLAGLRTALVGSSAGGCVATEAVRRGAPADALALLASPAAWVSFAGHPHEALRRITEEAGMAVAPEAMMDPTDWAAEFAAVTTENSIPHVKVPVLVVHGTEDDVVPTDHAQRIADRANDARLRIIEGAGHQLRRVPEAIDEVLSWLGQVIG